MYFIEIEVDSGFCRRLQNEREGFEYALLFVPLEMNIPAKVLISSSYEYKL